MKYYNDNDIYYSETTTGIINYIDLSNIPKRGKSFDWKNTNHPAPFRYLGKEGTLHIKYSPSQSKTPLVELTYQDITFTLQVTNLKRVKLNYVITNNKRYTMNDYQVGDIVKGCEILAIKKKNEKYFYLLYNIKEEVYGTLSNQELKTLITDSYVPHSTVPQSKLLYHHKHIHKYVKNRKDLFNNRYSSRKLIKTVCPNCHRERTIRVVDLVYDKFTCPCRKSYSSFGERVTQAYLDVLNIQYVREYKVTELGLRRFDFYLPKHNTVIEVHGAQHYKRVTGHMNHKKARQSDMIKKRYCKDNGIAYIEVDARKSTFKHIIDSLNQYTYVDPELIKKRYKEVYSK